MNRLAKRLTVCCATLAVIVPLAKGDRVCLLNGPMEAAQARFDLAVEAQRELNISYFYVGGEEDDFTMRGSARSARPSVRAALAS